MDSVELELSVIVTCELIVHTPECFFYKFLFSNFFSKGNF